MNILIASTRTSAGKTTVALGLGLLAQDRGRRIGYFKPLSDRIASRDEVVYDCDAQLIHQALRLEDEPRRMSLIHDYATLIEDRRGEDLKRAVVERFRELSPEKELMLIEGPRNYSYGSFLRLSIGELGGVLQSPVLLVASGGLGVVVDKALAAAHTLRSLGAELYGVVINRVPKEELEAMREVAGPALGERELRLLGIIPCSEELAPLTPRQVTEALKARILAGEEGLDRRIENTLVGAMTVDHALKGLRRYRNVALVTGGDRADLQFAALEVSTSCLILSGGIYPDPSALAKADELGIPVLLVPEDTYAAARRVEAVEPQLSPKESTLKLLKGLIEEHVTWQGLLG